MPAQIASPPVPLRVLLVEDRSLDTELVIDTLQHGGFAPALRRVETRAEFLEAMAWAPEIILADYSLPGFSGLEALALQCERSPDCPFILISGTVGEEIVVEAMRLGASDFLFKDRLVRLGPAVHRALDEKTLRIERFQSEEKYRTLFEQAADGIYISDSTGRLLDTNRYGCELFDCTRARVLGSCIANHIVRAERPLALENIRLATDGVRTGRYHFRRRDGSLFTGETRLKALSDGRLLCIVRDVTEREATLSCIREQADLLNQTHDCIVVTDLQGIITYWNKGAELLSGWTAVEAIGRHLEDLQGPALRANIKAACLAVYQTGTWHQETSLRSKTGESFLLDLRITLLRDPDGQPTGLLTIATDITEKRRIEEQFLRAQRLGNLGLLAAGIAHDLNNILTPIMMIAPLLSERLPSESDQRLLATLEQSVGRGAGLVKQILSFAHGSGVEFASVQVKYIARDIAALIKETFPRHLRFVDNIATDLWTAYANPSQIHQVLLNLCINARDAMPDGGELRLRLANITIDPVMAAAIPESRLGRFILVEVADTGCGIPLEILERIWEPFFTTKGEGKGMGLGLSTIRGILSSHHGFVALESTVGRGTTFRIYLPAETGDKPTASSTSAPPVTNTSGDGEIILIVDDEAEVRKLVSATLIQHGYRTLVAGNGQEALALFTAKPEEISLVITDSHMPGLSGQDFIVALRKEKSDVRVLLCTGLIQPSNPGAKPEETLLKPFEVGTLLATVQRMLK